MTEAFAKVSGLHCNMVSLCLLYSRNDSSASTSSLAFRYEESAFDRRLSSASTSVNKSFSFAVRQHGIGEGGGAEASSKKASALSIVMYSFAITIGEGGGDGGGYASDMR